MKISDLLGSQHELLALRETSESVAEQTEITNRPDLSEQIPETEDQAEESTFIAPLQQKIELLKKAVDVDNYYGENDDEEPAQPMNITINIPKGQSATKIDLTVNGRKMDPVQQVKKLAGIPVAAIFTAGDDEPLDS